MELLINSRNSSIKDEDYMTVDRQMLELVMTSDCNYDTVVVWSVPDPTSRF